MGPKEDPQAAKDRTRERRLSLLDRRETSEETAGGLTSDLRAVYGLRGLSMFGKRGKASGPNPAATAAKAISTPDIRGR